MSFLELVKKRKSVRAYSSRPIPKDMLKRCLEAARMAPSACNSQPWSFIIIDNEELKNKVAAAAFSGIYAMNDFACKAPVLAVAITEHSAYTAALGGLFRGIHFNRIDIGIACQHFVLQAQEEGLGSCWLGWFNENAVKKILNVPKHKKIDIISLGYPEAEEDKEKKRKSLEEMRRYNNEKN